MNRSLRFMSACVAVLAVCSSASRLTAAGDVLQRSRAMYSALGSYADTGAVIVEYGAGSKDRHTFTTYFRRAPRGFWFDFRKDSGDRYVIWGDPDAFHSWWKTTGVKYDYPNPNNIDAFSLAGPNTYGSALKVSTLIYSKMQGPFSNFSDAVLDGSEIVGGHQCHRLVGTTYDTYGATGRQTNVRKLMVWIDADLLLVRKVVEERKPLPGYVDRVTTMFEPQANPTLDDSRFRFAPPEPK
jgi:outer membrane lipoprotein-sorting protein